MNELTVYNKVVDIVTQWNQLVDEATDDQPFPVPLEPKDLGKGVGIGLRLFLGLASMQMRPEGYDEDAGDIALLDNALPSAVRTAMNHFLAECVLWRDLPPTTKE
jgi:hypothetical protein